MVKVKEVSIKCISLKVTQSEAEEFAAAPLKFCSNEISVATKVDFINKTPKNA